MNYQSISQKEFQLVLGEFLKPENFQIERFKMLKESIFLKHVKRENQNCYKKTGYLDRYL